MWNPFKRKEKPNLKSLEDDLSDDLQGRINEYVINALPNMNLDQLYKLPYAYGTYYNFYMVVEDKELYNTISGIHNRRLYHFTDCVDEKRKLYFSVHFIDLDCLNVLGDSAFILFKGRLTKLDLI